MQEGLCLDQPGERRGIRRGVAPFLVADHAGVGLGLLVHPVELLILLVGADHAADKREGKHGDQHDKTGHRQPVAEEPLCHQRAGGKYFYAAVVVQ